MGGALAALAALSLYYAGAVYGTLGLLAAGLALGAAVVLCLALACWSLAQTRVSLDAGEGEAVRDGTARAKLRVENRTLLPSASFSVVLHRTRPDEGGRPETATVFGTVSGHRALNVPVEVNAGHCGAVDLSVSRLTARDPLGLFAPRRREHAAARFVVLPQGGHPVPVEGDGIGAGRAARGGGAAGTRPGPEPPDVLDVRPWQPGDAQAAVHWKLSARTGELQTKRFAGEEPVATVLLLDYAAGNGQAAETLDAAARFDAWCEAAANLAEGMAASGVAFNAVGPAAFGDHQTWERTVTAPDGVRPLLRTVVEAWAARSCPDPARAAAALRARELADGAPFVLCGDLALRCGDDVLARFDAHGRLTGGANAVRLASRGTEGAKAFGGAEGGAAPGSRVKADR